MKKLFLYFSLLFVILLFSPASKATDIYFAQTAAGANNGTSCANAYAWTDGTHGINLAGNWVAGNILHLCGTITAASAGTTGITSQAAGTSASPITITFEPGAILQSPRWSGSVGTQCAPQPGGGIKILHNYVIVDGGLSGSLPQGIVQNTANGVGLANSTSSEGVYVSADFDIVRNLIVKNIFVRTAGTDSTGECTGGIVVGSGSYSKVCNNIVSEAELGMELNYGDSEENILTALPNCQDNTFPAHSLSAFNNSTMDTNHSIQLNGKGAPLVANNSMLLDSDNWSGNSTIFHNAGLFIIGDSNTLFAPQIVGNFCQGDQVGNPTGCYYQTYGGSGDGSGSSVNYFNNICYGTKSATGTGAVFGGQCFSWNNTAGNQEGPDKVYHNTAINTGFANESYFTTGNLTGFDYRGNLNISQPGGAEGYFFQGGSALSWAIATTQGNVYYLGRTGGGNAAFGWFNGGLTNFAGFQSSCSGNSGHECDSNSKLGDPLLAAESTFSTGTKASDNSAFYLAAGSSAIGIADNLTSQCSSHYGLCISAPQFPGAGGSCGSGCVARPSTGNWDAGAFQFSGVTSYWTPNLTAVSSGPTFRDFSWTGFPEGEGTTLDSSAVGQYVTFTVNVATAGTYDVKYSTKEYSTRGIAQLSINGTNVGAAQDQYAPCCGTYVTYDLGNYNFATAGNYSFKFTVTGKNASSTSYTMAWDDIILK